MRLTLRTMLGFMDGVLEPKDAQEISQKIEESEFARGLLNRMRDLMRRVRLPAPEPHDHGQGLDANSVAEYLDNTLPGGRVADFEKVCLESDMHLAEVASCHQILALVLGEPAEVEDRSRQRMYKVPALAEAKRDVEEVAIAAVAHARAAAAPEKHAPLEHAKSDDKGERHKPEVPEYLREEPPAAVPASGSLMPILAAVLLGLLLITLVLGALGQLEPGTPLGDLVRGITGSTQLAENAEKPAESAGKDASPANEPAKPPADVAKKPAPAETKPAGTPPAATPPAGAAAEKKEAPANPAVAAPAVPPGAVEAKPAMSATAAAPTPEKPAAAPPATTITIKPPAGAGGTATAAPAAPPSNQMAALTPANPAASTPLKPTLPSPAAASPEQVGLYVSASQILLENDTTLGWRRLPGQAAVKTGTTLLALPAFQPTVTLRVPVSLQMMGGTAVEFVPADAKGVPGVRVHFGRLVLHALATAELRVLIGRQEGVLSLQNADSVVALEISRTREWGANPEEQPGPWRGELYGVGGKVTWSEEGIGPRVLPPAHHLFVGAGLGATPPAAVSLPAWTLTGDDATGLDKLARPRLERDIRPDRSVLLSLRELLNAQQREVVSLTIRSLGYVGEFDPMAAVLDSAEQRAVWDDYLNQLQLALGRGPEVAAQVRQGFEKQYPSQAALLYRMLWGYTPKDINEGAGATLVGYLDHEQLVFRVLAFYNLDRLTGKRFGYRPYDPANKRQPMIVRWRELLSTGLLAPRPGAKPAAGAKQ